MNAGCGAGELSPGQSWTWIEAKTSEHLLVRSVSPQAEGTIIAAALDGDGDRCLLLQETRDGICVVDGDDIADAILSSLNKSNTASWQWLFCPWILTFPYLLQHTIEAIY